MVPILSQPQCVNTMVADGQAMQGTRASAAMVLPKFCNILASASIFLRTQTLNFDAVNNSAVKGC